jgi:mannose-6-phosphate isomerase
MNLAAIEPTRDRLIRRSMAYAAELLAAWREIFNEARLARENFLADVAGGVLFQQTNLMSSDLPAAPILFRPILQERVWGGRTFETDLGRELPPGKVIGESWEVVDRPEACSVIDGGEFSGLTLREALERNAARILGPGADPKRPFPILVKRLDCRDRLSLQVHPPAAVAPSLKGEPKTEMWYVATASPEAAVLAGLKPGVDRVRFEAALRDDTAADLILRHPMVAGDSLFVPSGRIHAIDAGNLILEIQQNSDTTYRVYDWGRVGLDGKPRALHVEESMKSIDFADDAPAPLRGASLPRLGATLADCAEFRVRRWDTRPGDAVTALPAGEGPRLIHAVNAPLRLVESKSGDTFTIPTGRNALLPAGAGYAVHADTSAVFLVTDRFMGR